MKNGTIIKQNKTQNINKLMSRVVNTSYLDLSSVLGILSPEVHGEDIEELRKIEDIILSKK